MDTGIFNLATCQFAIGSDIRRNGAQIRRQIRRASELGADVAHFPETALSGYPGADIDASSDIDWNLIHDETCRIQELAAQLGIWVILGSSHKLSDGNLPHNSLYAIDPNGAIVERYDKRFCTGGDLRNYTAGDHFSVVTINGVRCGMLICYDVRFPELYRAYVRENIQCMFHSFYNARADGPGIHTTIMRPTLQARAASNFVWVSANNSSAYYGSWPSVFVRPNGEIAGSLRFNRAGVMVNTVDTTEQLYDAAGGNRKLAMDGTLSNGETVVDPRSSDRTCL
jgi:deaminated glutathione amidase